MGVLPKTSRSALVPTTNRERRPRFTIDGGMDIVGARASTTATPSLLDEAVAALRRAEAAAQVQVTELSAMPDIAAATALWDRIWQSGSGPRLGPEMLRALTHAGNYLSGAVQDGRMVGALAGFYATGDELHLHSHILGVDPRARAGGVGFALKLHQRVWALERKLSRITWTFDPLVSANAYFNVSKLGAEGVEYHANFYGVMPDAINGNDDTDRVLISWQLDSARVARACMGEAVPSGDMVDGAPYALRVLPDGGPALDHHVAEDGHGGAVLCALPRDIVAMRRDDPERAAAWRRGLRTVLTGAFAGGLRLQGVTREGVYVLARRGLG
jgi:predicted GNAT superfamily acetyltransferase